METLKKSIMINIWLIWINIYSKNKYLAPTNESREKLKKFEEIWSKIKDLIGSITKNSDDYDEKYMTIKINSDDELPLNKTIEIFSMIIFVRAVCH